MKAFQVTKTNYFIIIRLKLFGVLIHVYVRKKQSKQSETVTKEVKKDVTEN
jgi:hypothetical protein